MMKFSVTKVTSSLLLGLLMSFAAVQKAHSYELYSNIDRDEFIDITGIDDFLPPSAETDYEIISNAARVENDSEIETLTLIETGETTGGQYSLGLGSQPPLTGPPEHFHTQEDEWFYITQGQYEFEIEGESIIANPGDLIISPAGERHRPLSVGATPSDIYFVWEPSGIEEFFRATSTEALESSPIPDNLQIASAAEKAGLVFVDNPFESNDTAKVPEPSLDILAASTFGTILLLKRKRKSVSL